MTTIPLPERTENTQQTPVVGIQTETGCDNPDPDPVGVRFYKIDDVIQGLECCRAKARCTECPYHGAGCLDSLHEDAHRVITQLRGKSRLWRKKYIASVLKLHFK